MGGRRVAPYGELASPARAIPTTTEPERAAPTRSPPTPLRSAVSTAAAVEVSPLAAIERRVQERAATLALRMDSAEGAGRLRALIDDEIEQWDLEHKRGRQPLPLTDADAVAERALRNLAGYGPLQELLDDPDVWE